MEIVLEGYFKKFFITVPIDAKVRVDIPLEFFLKGKVKDKVFEALSRYNFNGVLKIDHDSYRFIDGMYEGKY